MLILYSKDTTSFSSLGLGVLKDFKTDPIITEVLNGEYNLEFEYSKIGFLNEYLKEENIIKANGQLFRIWDVDKNNTSIKILAKHIVFDLSKNFLVDVAPTDQTAQNALNWILNRTETPNNFIVTGDCTKSASARYVRTDPITAIYSADNALIKRFGGELEFDNFNIFVHKKRGKDLGLEIRQGKNLSSIQFKLDFSTTATRIMPQGKDELLLPEKFIDSPLINNYFMPLYQKINFDIGIDDNTTEEEALNQLRNAVNSLYDQGIDKPTISIQIDFIELSKTIEYKKYKSLESAHLGDTVKAVIPDLNLNLKTRLVKTIYNCNLERITNLELGTITPDFVSNQNQQLTELKNEVIQINPDSILRQAQDHATELINHPFNGYIVISKDTGEMFLCDNPDISQAEKIWKFGLGGIGFSSNGLNGPFSTAITQDGQIVADFITAGQLSVSRIEGLADELSGIKSSIELNNNNVQIAIAGTGGNNKFINPIGYFGTSSWLGKIKPYFNTEIQLESGEKSCWILQNGTATQTIQVRNGIYTISFLYKKILSLSNCKIRINDIEYTLSETNFTKFSKTINVTNNTIKFEMISDTDDSCYICILMCNEGEIAQPYSNNANETVTDTVKISDGIEISSSKMNVKQKQDADGNRIINTTTGEVVTEYTDKGTKTKEFESTGTSKVNGVLFAKIGNQTWLTGV